MRKAKLRTLIDPAKHVCGVFQPDFFCEVDEDCNPFNSFHLVYVDNEYIGVIFRDYPDEPWRYGLRGVIEPCRKIYKTYPEAIAALFKVFQRDKDAWQDWIDSIEPLTGGGDPEDTEDTAIKENMENEAA